MGVGYLKITGNTKHIDVVEQEWQSDQTDKRVLLLSTMAGGVSLTLDAADDLVLIDETDNPDDQEQTEDRVHRTSRTDHQVTIYHLISEGSIDESISVGNLGHDFAQKAVLDGRRGVEYARKALEGKG
jgi:SNF2 family DNA or RNA helicase